MSSLLYTAELDLAEDDIAPFLSWYAFRHAPDLYPLGFQTCACYRTVGGDMNLFDIYQIPGVELFSEPGYRRMNARDHYAARILEKRRNKAHTIYAPISLGRDDGLERPFDADWITVARFDAPREQEDIAASLSLNVAHWRAQGAMSIRFAARTTGHPVYTTHRPRYMLVIEWPHEPDPALEVEQRLRAGVGEGIKALDCFEGQRLFPWPDAPRHSRSE